MTVSYSTVVAFVMGSAVYPVLPVFPVFPVLMLFFLLLRLLDRADWGDCVDWGDRRRPLLDATSAATNGGRRRCHSVPCSYANEARRTVASSNGLPINCRPMGNPLENPHGTEMPGRPARFTGIV